MPIYGPQLNNNKKEQHNPPNDLCLANSFKRDFKQQDILAPAFSGLHIVGT